MRNCSTHRFETEYLQTHRPLLAFDENRDFDLWRTEVRAKLTELLGLPFEKCDPDFWAEEPVKKEGYTDYPFSVQTEREYYVPCHVLIPETAEKPVPLTVCLSGHGSGMNLALGEPRCEKDVKSLEFWPHRAMGLRAIRDGRAALVLEARSFGLSSDCPDGIGTSCTESCKIALLMGRTVIGERVWDVMRVLDVLPEHFPQIDMTHIVCTGNSGGGTAAYYLACFEDRIGAFAPSCSVCNYADSIAAMPHCLCNHIPSVRKYFEMGDLACLIAPKKLVIAAGEKDDIFPIEGVKRAFDTIKKIYRAAGAQENCALVVGPEGHLNYADLIWEKLTEMNAL